MRVLFFHPGLSSFIRTDLQMLMRHFDVAAFEFNPRKKILTPLCFIRQTLFLFRRLWSADAIVCDFAGYLSFLPALLGRLTGKKVLIILCGTECYAMPTIGYGNFNKRLLGMFTCWSLRLADHVLPVHKRLIETEYTYADVGQARQGFRHFCPKATATVTELNYGYDPEKFKPTGVARDPSSFLTVASHTDGSTYFRKGVDLILEVAALLPDCRFTIVGQGKRLESSQLPPNVTVMPKVTQEVLRDLYSSHRFYLQVSMAEGFPNALCEAMLCGCVPIGSDVAAIPDIIGNAGFILKKKDATMFEELIRTAISGDIEAMDIAARERIRLNWPYEKREKLLIGAVRGH